MNISVYLLLVIKVWDLPKGEGFLPRLDLGHLRRLYQKEQKAKPKLRLLCAIHRKEGKSIDEIVAATDMKRRTVHETLRRFVERGLTAKDSIKQKGKEPKLTIKERRMLIARLDRGPPYNKHGLWTTKDVRELIRREFNVEYSHVHVWELLQAAGFSIQNPRPRNYQAPSKQKEAHFKKRLICWRVITDEKAS